MYERGHSWLWEFVGRRASGIAGSIPLPLSERSEDRGRGKGWGFRGRPPAPGFQAQARRPSRRPPSPALPPTPRGLGAWGREFSNHFSLKGSPPNVRAERGQGEGRGVGVPGAAAGPGIPSSSTPPVSETPIPGPSPYSSWTRSMGKGVFKPILPRRIPSPYSSKAGSRGKGFRATLSFDEVQATVSALRSSDRSPRRLGRSWTRRRSRNRTPHRSSRCVRAPPSCRAARTY